MTATESDNDAAGVTVNPTALTVAEGDSAKYTVVLTTAPSANVTITASFASGSDEDVTVSDESLTFTTETWSTAQEVTVSVAEDADAANGAATIAHSASGGGYGDVSVPSVTVTESDNDEAGIILPTTTLTVMEGSSATYEVMLATQPLETITVKVETVGVNGKNSQDPNVSISPSALTFTPDSWNMSKYVTVTAVQDKDADNETATLRHSASGRGYDGIKGADMSVTVMDDDEAGITLPNTLTVTEGSSATYEVALATRPSETITVTVTDSEDPNVDISPSSLVFTPETWDTTQPVTVTAIQDNDTDDETATLSHSASGAGYDQVQDVEMTVTVTDDDTVTVTISVLSVSAMEDAGNMSLTVVLDQPHALEVRASYATSDKEAVAGEDYRRVGGTLVFAPGETSHTIQVPIMKDDFDEDDETFMLTLSNVVNAVCPEGNATMTIANTIMDDDQRGVTVTPVELAVKEGDNATYEISLMSAPMEPITIDLIVTGDADVTVAPMSLAFTSDNWGEKQKLTVSATEDPDMEDNTATLTHKANGGDYGEVTIADVVVKVTDVSGQVDVSGWLARYSRVGARHLLSSLENRMEGVDRGISGAEVSVAGQRIAFGDSPEQPGRAFSGASALWSASQNYTAPVSSGGRSVRLRNSYGMSSGLNAAASRFMNLTFRDALSRSAFRYAREMSSGDTYGIWGQGAFSRFGGSKSGADLTGDVMSGTVGIDHSVSGWLRGFAVSRSESEGAYRIAGEDSLSLAASLTGVYPYARYRITDRLRVWGAGGFGGGSLRLERDSLASPSSSSSLSMALGSVGMSGDIVSAGSQGFGLSWQTDAMLVRSSLASSQALSPVSTTVHRLRLSLESSYILRMGERASLSPKLQLGVRRDGGDAEQGMGLDVVSGLNFVHPAWGLRAQVDMHGLVVHEDSDFKQWGVSGTILFDRSPSSALGPSLRLTPSWGSPSSSGGMRALWSRETVSGLAGFRGGGDVDDHSLRLDSRFDYGFTALGEGGVASPYASVSVSGNEAQSASAGAGADLEVGGGLGYSNRSLGLRMQAGMRGLASEEEAGFKKWGASGSISFDPDPSSPLGASFSVSQSWRIAPQTGFGGSQSIGMRQPATGISRSNIYGQPMRVEGEMGYGFPASGGKGVATPYAGVAFSDGGRSGVLLGFNLQTGKRFLLNFEGSTPENKKITLNSMPELRVRGLLKW